MERYQAYMDGIHMPDALEKKLLSLQKPPAQKQPWQRWCALAAVLAVVICVSILGIRGIRPGHTNPIPLPPGASETPDQTGNPSSRESVAVTEDPRDPSQTAAPEMTEAPEATERLPLPPPNPVPGLDGERGYTVHRDGIAVFYDLPELLFGGTLPHGDSGNYLLGNPDDTTRQLDPADVLCLAGGEEAMEDHILWAGLYFQGDLYFDVGGALDALSIFGESSAWSVGLELCKGKPIPDCVVMDPDWTTEWQGISVTGYNVEGYSYDGVLYSGCRVYFEANGYGWKYTAFALSSGTAEELCARFVRYAAAGAFHPECLSAAGSAYNEAPPVPDDLGGIVLPSQQPDIPDRGTPPADMPPADIIRPGEEGYDTPPAEPSSELPDRGTPPSDMPTANIIHPGEEGYVDPLPPPNPPDPGVDQ